MQKDRIGKFFEILGDHASLDDVDKFEDYLPRIHYAGRDLLPYVERYFFGKENLIISTVILGLHAEGRLDEIIARGKDLTQFDREWDARRRRAREVVNDDPGIVAMVLEEEHPDKFRVVDLLVEEIEANVAHEKASETYIEYDPKEPHILSNHPNPVVASCFRDDAQLSTASATVSEARKSLAARTGRSMRSVIAATIGMKPSEIDRLAA